MYSLLRALLFKLDAELSHDVALQFLSMVSRLRPLLRLLEKAHDDAPRLGTRMMGLQFTNPVGLAAGLDKDARAFPALAALGFGCIELGTVTPRPQPGQKKKRMFRLVEDRAIINRMGFNSCGLAVFVTNVQRLRHRTTKPIGINIGKNAHTPIERAVEDYLSALETVYDIADYIAINISSPNTASLRDLQGVNSLDEFLHKIIQRRAELASRSGKTTPLALKIAPDLESDEIANIAGLLEKHGFDAVIATNTTVSRPPGLRSRRRAEPGGLSGAPLAPLTTQTIATLRRHLDGRVPIIGVGGISSADDALRNMDAGADMLQLYTGLVYQGPVLIKQIVIELERKMRSMHSTDMAGYRKKMRP